MTLAFSALIAVGLWGVAVLTANPGAPVPVDCSSGDMRLITAEPQSDIERNRPFPTEVYCLAGDRELVKLWEISDRYTRFVQVHEAQGVPLVGAGQAQAEQLYAFSTNDLSKPQPVLLPGTGTFLGVHLIADGAVPTGLEVKRFDAQTGKFTSEYLDWQTKSAISTPVAEERARRQMVPVGGPGRSQDVTWVKLNPAGKLSAGGPGALDFPGVPVPAGMRSPESTRGWNVITNSEAYLAIQQVPYAKGQSKSTTLVYLKDSKEWHSYVIDGAESWLRLVGGWFVGQVARQHPDTDPERHLSLAPVLDDRFVLINPARARRIVLQLGKDAEILLIIDDRMVYWQGQALFRGTLTETGLTGQKRGESDSSSTVSRLTDGLNA